MKKQRAFSLVELLLAMTITTLLVALLANIANVANDSWQRGSGQAESFSGARGALSFLGRELQGAVIDLDLGFYVEQVDENDYTLKFISRRKPTAEHPAVEKVIYQLGWASRDLLPTVQRNHSTTHPIPVLIRTTSTDMEDIFDVVQAGDSANWVEDWDPLRGGSVQTGVEVDMGGGTMQITEVAAENVLGWRVIPLYWDKNDRQVISDDPNLSGSVHFLSTPGQQPRYLISNFIPEEDKKGGTGSKKTLRALSIEMAVVPSRSLVRLTSFSEWGEIRSMNDLFDLEELGSGAFENLLRENMRTFDATFFLSSKSP